MGIFCNIALTLVFLGIAFVHIYWAFGGNWGKQAAVPTNSAGIPLFVPGFFSCFSVGTIFLFLSILINQKVFNFIPDNISNLLLLVASLAFLVRAIGDFNYVGFFKKVNNTIFSKKDNYYYSPLCLVIAVLIVVKLLIEY